MTAVIKRFRKALLSIYKSDTKRTTRIERYLNYLPEDILTLDIIFKGIKSLPDLTRFKNLKQLYCYGNKLKYLPNLPESLEILYCGDNNLTSLPDLTRFKNLERLNCSGNNLTSLPDLPNNLKILYCNNNELTSLPLLPENLERLHCENNQLTLLPTLPNNLKMVYCNNNKLTSLPLLPENLETLFCFNNQITSLALLLKKLQFNYFNNPIYEIVDSNTLFKTNNKIQILNNFRHLYYCLKFKKQLRNWLWEKVREVHAMKKYSPLYLIKNLGDEDDLDTILDDW